jgi:hypothetical protein
VASSALPSSAAAYDPGWSRIRRAVLKANPRFQEASFNSAGVAGNKVAFKDPPLVGPALGRVWEVVYYRPTFFSPKPLVYVVTAIRWDEPERLALYETPWLYIGGRPRIFSRLSPDLERIIERQKKVERSLKGYRTGDAEFDRRWAFYVYRSRPSEVLHDAGRRRWLESLAALSPGRGADVPTIASVGTTASLGVVVDDSDATVRAVGELVPSFAQLLDAVESSTGNLPASVRPLTMDLLPDGSGYPSPTLRFRCVHCGVDSHPRFVPDFQTEVCAECRKGLYSAP